MQERKIYSYHINATPACPNCGGLLYSVEGGFYCGGCGWDDLPEVQLTQEAE